MKNTKLDDREVLLVKEKDSKTLQEANMDAKGTVSRAKPGSGENPVFLDVDTHSGVLKNFFKNFHQQVEKPTRFDFFRVALEGIKRLQEALKSPNDAASKELLDNHRVNPEDFLPKQEQEKKHYILADAVIWEMFERYGVNRELLERTGNMDKLLNYQKTGLMFVALKLEYGEILHSDARFSLREMENGSFIPKIHLIRHKPDLERPYFGITFSEEDKKNLLTTGNLGRVAEAEFKKGEKTLVFVSVDKLTNELAVCRQDRVKVPDEYKGVKLSEEQKQALGEGKAVRVENMTSSTKGTIFSADVQFNADSRFFEVIFDKNRKQEQGNRQDGVPKTFRGKELTEDQRTSLEEGKTVYMKGLTDKNKVAYSGYITINKETGKIEFMFTKEYQAALAAGKVIPDDRYKKPVAVNPESNTPKEQKKEQPKPEEKPKKETKNPKKSKVNKF